MSKRKIISDKNDTNHEKNTIATLMQPSQYDLQRPVGKDHKNTGASKAQRNHMGQDIPTQCFLFSLRNLFSMYLLNSSLSVLTSHLSPRLNLFSRCLHLFLLYRLNQNLSLSTFHYFPVNSFLPLLKSTLLHSAHWT